MGESIDGYNADLEQSVTRLLALKNEDGTVPSLEMRKKAIDKLMHSHISVTGRTPDGVQVQRLANWLLYESLTNCHPDKVSRVEYPIMTKRQLRSRYKRERATEHLQERYLKTSG